MCLCCDLVGKRIPKHLAQKIEKNPATRRLYDEFREYDVNIQEILAIFDKNNWDAARARKENEGKLMALKKNKEKKIKIREASDEFVVD
jgi:hypothetical protein